MKLIFEYNDGSIRDFVETESNVREVAESKSYFKSQTVQDLSKQISHKIVLWNDTNLGIVIEAIAHSVLNPVVDWLLPLDIQGSVSHDVSASINFRLVSYFVKTWTIYSFINYLLSTDINDIELHFLYMKRRHLYPSVVSLSCMSSNLDSFSFGSNNNIRSIINDSWEWRSWFLCANESHYFYSQNCSPFLCPLEDTGVYRFTKTFSWDDSKGEYTCYDGSMISFNYEYPINYDMYVQQLRRICVLRSNFKRNVIDLSIVEHGLIDNKCSNVSIRSPTQRISDIRVSKPLRHLELPIDMSNPLDLLNIFDKSAAQVLGSFPNVTNTLQLLCLLTQGDNLLQNCSEQYEKMIECLLTNWLKTFNPLPITERPRLRNIYHNYLDSKMRGFSSGTFIL